MSVALSGYPHLVRVLPLLNLQSKLVFPGLVWGAKVNGHTRKSRVETVVCFVRDVLYKLSLFLCFAEQYSYVL